jgi:hypothetical protein
MPVQKYRVETDKGAYEVEVEVGDSPAAPTGVASAKAQPASAPTLADPADVIIGFGQGAATAAVGAADLVATGLRKVPGVRNFVPDESRFDAARAKLEPQNAVQKAGKTVEQIGEFFVPAAKIGKAKAALATGRGALDVLIGAGLEGASAGAVGSLQTGDATDGAKTGALAAGATAGFQAAAKPVGSAVKWLGERVERALIKPTQADVRDGFLVSNIFRHNLGGSLSQTYDKVTDAIKAQGQKLAGVANISDRLGRTVDPLAALNTVEASLTTGAARNTGQNAAMQRAIAQLREDLAGQGINGPVSWSTGNEIKQAMGDLGAWLHDPTGRTIADPNAKALEAIANKLYAEMKTQLAQQAIGPVSAINKTFSELLPIRHAIIRRIPVEQRQNVLNLGDIIGVSTGSLGLSIANRLLRSGQFANLAAQGGQGLSDVAVSGAPTVGRVTAATGSVR